MLPTKTSCGNFHLSCRRRRSCDPRSRGIRTPVTSSNLELTCMSKCCLLDDPSLPCLPLEPNENFPDNLPQREQRCRPACSAGCQKFRRRCHCRWRTFPSGAPRLPCRRCYRHKVPREPVLIPSLLALLPLLRLRLAEALAILFQQRGIILSNGPLVFYPVLLQIVLPNHSTFP